MVQCSQVLGVCRETVSTFSRTWCEKRQESEVCLKLSGLVSSQYTCTYLHKLYLSMLAWSETGKEGPRLIALPISYSATQAQLVGTHVCTCEDTHMIITNNMFIMRVGEKCTHVCMCELVYSCIACVCSSCKCYACTCMCLSTRVYEFECDTCNSCAFKFLISLVPRP